MSDGVERTKHVRRKTTPAFIKFNYMEETSNLDNKTSKAVLVWVFFFLIKGFFYLTGKDSLLPITKIWMKT